MIKVTLIRPSGCSHCAQVKNTLEKLKNEFKDLQLEEIDMTTDQGFALVEKYKIMASPGILVNDEFFAMGGATEEQLREKFEQLLKK